MAPFPLTGAPYVERGLIAGAQECVNLYAEDNSDDPQAPVPISYYPFPGTTLFATPLLALGVCRCTYRTSKGTAYIVIGNFVYSILSNGATIFVGAIADRASQVYMADNGLAIVIVDGSGEGWAIDMATNAFGQIIDPSFYGADFVVFLDTFFVFNRPDTNQFYISLSMVDYALLTTGTSFDPLDIAAKAGSADPIVGISTTHGELWLIGELTTEVWIGTGAADFFFQKQQGAFIDHGCGAQYSIATIDIFTFFIMQDRQGQFTIVRAGNYELKEISTPGIVKILQQMAQVRDAIGFCFQLNDHPFYCVQFPTANRTFIFDLKTGRWAEWLFLNAAGELVRSRANCCMFAHGRNLIGDFEKGYIYQLDATAFTNPNPDDINGATLPIPRIKTFAHLLQDGDRVMYTSFIANIECGTASPDLLTDDDNDEDDDPIDELLQLDLDWSDDRGRTYGNKVSQSLGRPGEYLTQPQWNRLGYARDRVFRLSWSAPVETTLNGAFIEMVKAKS